MTARRAAALLLVAVLLVAGWPSPASAAPRAGGVPRLLVLSLPTLAWEDLHRGDTPALDALVDASAIGAMSVRDILPLTNAADAYATIGAGTRARGVVDSAVVVAPDEPVGAGTAAQVYEQRTGRTTSGGLVALGTPELLRRNRHLDYDSEPGALGQALAEAGVARSTIANADALGGAPGTGYERSAGTALADPSGVVPAGTTSADLLTSDPAEPYGTRYDVDRVADAFGPLWTAGGVVLVEGSDLVRADRQRARGDEDDASAAAHRRAALRSTDALVARLLEAVDPAVDGVLLVAPYHEDGTPHLTVAAVRAPGFAPGLLESATTRRSGIVTLVDVAPTILSLVGVGRPDSMEGRPFERTARGAATAAARAEDLERVDHAARFRDDMVAWVAVTFVALQALLWGVAALALQRRSRWGKRFAAVAALAMLAYLPVTYLAALFRFDDHPAIAYWLALFSASAAIGAGALLLARRHRLDPLLAVLGLVFGLLVVDMLLGARLQLNTVFGYSPTVGGRFAGMGNLAFGQFGGAAFVLFGLIIRRSPATRAVGLAFAVLGVAVVIDGMPIWGSDVGGVLALVPAIAITVLRYRGTALKLRTLVLGGLAGVVVVGGFAAIDLSRPEDQRTHLGRLVASIGDRGFGAFETVISRKLGANLNVIFSSVWTAMVPIALGFALYLLWKAPGQIRAIRDAVGPCLPGLGIVGFLGFALNDSGIAVPGVLLGVVNASLVYLAVRVVPGPGDAVDPPEAVAAPEPAS